VVVVISEPSNNLSLSMPPNIAVARERCEDVLMAEVLTPGLVLLGRFADLTTEKSEGLPEAVWIEVG